MPTVAIIGRPNVGKSTLFNRFVGQRKAIVQDYPGTTRDRLYGKVQWNEFEFVAVDTGGVVIEPKEDEVSASITHGLLDHVKAGVDEADLILFLVDGRADLTSEDRHALELVRHSGNPAMLVVNKLDDVGMFERINDFYSLGLGEPIPVSALSGRGSGDLLDIVVGRLRQMEASGGPDAFTTDPLGEHGENEIRVAIVGRPNVGKSTLLNALYGMERSIVSDIPGTTRDAIDVQIQFEGKDITLVDTAGIRKRGKVEKGIEQYSVLRAEQAVDRSDIALVLIDGSVGLTAQDTHIIGYVHEHFKSLIILANKWDLVRAESAELKGKQDGVVRDFAASIRGQLEFVKYAPVLSISALTGLRVPKILEQILFIYSQRTLELTRKQVKDVFKPVILSHTPSSNRGVPLKVYEYGQSSHNPPTFVFEINRPDIIHFSYERYLVNRLREVYPYEGTPVKLVFSQSEKRAKKE